MELVVHVDGCSLGNPGESGAGIVILSPGGDVLWERGEYIGHGTNNTAEYRGLLRGLEEARRLGATSVRLQTDSELLVKQLRGEYRVKAPHLQKLYAQAVRLLRGFERARIVQVGREHNARADRLAKRAARTKRNVTTDLAENAEGTGNRA